MVRSSDFTLVADYFMQTLLHGDYNIHAPSIHFNTSYVSLEHAHLSCTSTHTAIQYHHASVVFNSVHNVCLLQAN